jgi:hypothetical protein
LKAGAVGLDYSEPGIKTSKELFAKFGISGDLRCDVFETSFAKGSLIVCLVADLLSISSILKNWSVFISIYPSGAKKQF